MKTWSDLFREAPDLAESGVRLLFQFGKIGLAFPPSRQQTEEFYLAGAASPDCRYQ